MRRNMAKTAAKKEVRKHIPVTKGTDNIEDLPDRDSKVAEIAYRKAGWPGVHPRPRT
jgi:hypothetical protein